jgi:leucyl aminopeptidase
MRFVKTSEKDPGQWVAESDILAFKEKHGSFMDVTNNRAFSTAKRAVADFPTAVQHKSVVNNAISLSSTDRTRAFLTEFSSYHNRYYTTVNGEESALSILAAVNAHVAGSDYAGKVTAEEFSHSWRQPSIIARIEGSDPALKEEIVVIGAHLDSVSFGSIGKAPGADDNGSGSSVLLEAFKSLVDAKFVPKRTIEFQWYAAEEVGLRGSQAIAEDYADRNVKVHSMINMDVVGYNEGRTEIGIITDNTDKSLTNFLKLLVDEYLDFTYLELACGYACSDHASFTKAGFAAAMPVEYDFHPDMHTARDTIDSVDFVQVKEFTKLALGYLIEISEPSA